MTDQTHDKHDEKAKRELRRQPGYARQVKTCPDPHLPVSERCLDARDCGWKEACAAWDRGALKAKDAGL